MKHCKKIISCLMIFTVLLGLWCASAGTEELFNPNADLWNGSSVTRAQFAQILLTMAGLEETAFVNGDVLFSDLDASSEDYAAAAAAFRLGYLDVNETAAFRPGEAVTLSEAVKGVLGVLGYTDVIRLAGGGGAYWSTAATLGLIPENAGNGDEPASPQVLQKMVQTALKTETMQLKTVGDEVHYEKTGRTLLEDKLEIYTIEGIVTANAYTALYYPDSGLPRGSIMIENQRFLCQDTMENYIGQRVKAYYKETTDGENQLVYVDNSRMEIVSANAEDIVNSGDGMVSIEQENGKERRLRLNPILSLIYNGKQKPFSPELLQVDAGNFLFIDHEEDGRIDVIVATVYETIVVDSVSSSDYTVTDRLSATRIELDSESSEYDVYISEGGAVRDFSSFSVGQILFYAASQGEGRNVKNVQISNATAVGTIAELREDTVLLGSGEIFKASPAFLSHAAVGAEGTFYLDPSQRIVYAEYGQRTVYGYLNDMAQEGLKKPELKIFTQNDRWVVLPLADRVTYNSQPGYTPSEVLENLGTDPGTYRQLITYRVTTDGEICEINTARQFERWSDEEASAIDNQIFRLCTSSTLRYAWGTFDGVVTPTPDTILFMVPRQSADDTAQDEEFSIMAAGSLPENTYTIMAYDCDRVMQPAVCVVESKGAVIDNSLEPAYIMVVKKVVDGYGDEGAAYSIKGFYRGIEYSLLTRNKEVLDGQGLTLSSGDIIQFALGHGGYVEQVLRLGNCNEDAMSISGNYLATATFVRGEVIAVDFGTSKASLRYGDKNFCIVDLTARVRNVYLYDREKKTVTVSQISDLCAGDKVFVTMRYGQVCEMVIIR